MRNLMTITASALALTIAGTGLAVAQDKAAPARPLTPDSVGAGAIKKDGAMQSDAMEKRRTAAPMPDRSRAADTAPYHSYNDSKQAFSGASIAGGLSAEQLIGADIKNASGDEIGEVEDLVIGADNKIEVAIVEVGGFLGLGSKTVAVRIDELRQVPKKPGFVTSMTAEELKTLPSYKKTNKSWVRTYN